MKWFVIFVVLFCGIVAAWGAIQWNPADSHPQMSGRLVVTGSSTVAPLVNEMAKRFESLHPNVRIDVQTGGSSRGIADARNGTADLGMASRALVDDEQDLMAHVIARDGVCVILHRDNPVSQLSSAQVRDIFTGKIQNWKQIGGVDAEITVVNKAEGRATLEVFLKYFDLQNPQIQADVVIGDNEQGIKTVTGNPHAIGYVSIGTAEYNREHGAPLTLIPAGGVDASIETLASGSFPISRPLIVVTKSTPTGLTRAFIDFCQSQKVHDLIQSQYFVPSTN